MNISIINYRYISSDRLMKFISQKVGCLEDILHLVTVVVLGHISKDDL